MQANATGVALDGPALLQTTLDGVTLDNPGGAGLHVLSAPATAQVSLLNSSFDLHATSLKMDTPVA